MGDLQEFKCPACGGAIEFDSGIQKMKCPYCDSVFDMTAFQKSDKDQNHEKSEAPSWAGSAGKEWEDGEDDGLSVYSCDSCGGEIVGDDNTASTSCPYCGNPVVMTEKLSGLLKPDYIIPFKLDENAAKEGLMKHFHNKWLLPKVFKDKKHIDEIKGIYVPFWLYNAEVHAKIHYNASRVRKWSDSEYRYTETSYFDLYRAGKIAFDSIPVDGSKKMPDELMQSIEPYRFEEMIGFQTGYLAGYLAEKYDEDKEESIEKARRRMKNSTTQSFRKTTEGYESCTEKSDEVEIRKEKTKYALFPVWLLNTTWNKTQYVFAMNGQTGKFVGDLPVDKKLFWSWFAGLTVAFSALVYGLISLIF